MRFSACRPRGLPSAAEMYEPNPLFGGVRKALGLGGASRVSAASKALADAQMQQFLTGRVEAAAGRRGVAAK